ncbi:MAG: hypothetical protein ACKVP4_07895 [Hyphomicrobium sp.]
MSHWPLAFLEFAVVLAFGIGWLVLEWYCKRLDKPTELQPDAQSKETPGAPRAAE